MSPPIRPGLGLSVYCLAVDPVQRNTLYAGTYGGGVVKSTDGGATCRAARLSSPASISRP